MKREFKNFVVFVEGVAQIGVVEELKLPDLELITETFHGAGTAGERKVKVGGVKEMETEISMRDVNRPFMNLFGVPDGPSIVIRASAATDKGEVSAVKITMNGLVVKTETGTLKPGSSTTQKHMLNLSYYKFEDAGDVVHEIDLDANKIVVNGVDLTQAERQALGI